MYYETQGYKEMFEFFRTFLLLITPLLALLVALLVAGFIARWRLNQKMGLKGWYILIPVYSEYKVLTVLYKDKSKFQLFVLALLLTLCFTTIMHNMNNTLLVLLLSFVHGVVYYLVIIKKIILGFGKSKTFSFIFGFLAWEIWVYMYLAFDKNEVFLLNDNKDMQSQTTKTEVEV